MAGSDGAERTEEPTPRRLEQARARGQVARSRDLGLALAGAAALLVLAIGLPGGFDRLKTLLSAGLVRAPRFGDGDLGLLASRVLLEGLLVAAAVLSPLLAALWLLGLLGGVLQTGGLFVPGLLKPDGSRLLPKLERVASRAAFIEAGKGLVVTGVFLVIGWVCVRAWLPVLPRLTTAGAQSLLRVLGALALDVGKVVVLATLVLGLADYLWQRKRHAQELRMTREEVKREHKESEGDPQHKAERQRLHRELLQQRMLADVRKADFVVVNPDHLAVAIRYDREGQAAPLVVASGENLIAERIKAVAREAGVPIFRDVTLARSLREVPEGDEIPESLFDAVAQILRLVYGMVDAEVAPAGAPPSLAKPGGAPSTWRRV